MSFLLLVIGFALLIKSADILIESASKLAKLFAIPPFIVGFSVIAFGTSAPELVIGIFSGIKQNNLITLGDVIGSCIANIALIIGVTAVIHPLTIDKSVLYKEIPLSFFVQLLLFILLTLGGVLSMIDAVILLILFAVFLFYIFNRSKDLGITDLKNEGEDVKEAEIHTVNSKVKLVGLLLISIIGVIIGGNLVVNSSTEIAHMFGLSDVLIGVTIVAIGTSLPELVTSIVAALKKQSDIAVGNIIGSNIFNILFVLGISSFIHPIPKVAGLNLDILTMTFATLLVFLIPLRRKVISKLGGTMLLALYIAFMIYKVLSV
mgnify:CR=1 FL=1